MKQAVVSLFDFSLGIGIQIGDERYNLINGNAEGIIQMIYNYDVDEIVLVGPKVITAKYERDLKQIDMTHFNNKNYKIIPVNTNTAKFNITLEIEPQSNNINIDNSSENDNDNNIQPKTIDITSRDIKNNFQDLLKLSKVK